MNVLPKRLGIVAAVLALLLTLMTNTGSLHPTATAAQSITAGMPVAGCGMIVQYSKSADGTTDIILNGDSSAAFDIEPNAYVAMFPATVTSIGSQLCVVGIEDATGRLSQAVIRNDSTLMPTLCGPLTAYIPPPQSAMPPSVGALIIGSTVLPVSPAATLGGPLTAGSTVCVSLRLDDLGDVSSGTVVSSTATSSGAILAACGTVTSYTAPTAGAAGTLGLTTGAAAHMYTIKAGSYLSSPPKSGNLLCLVGTTDASGQLQQTNFLSGGRLSTTVCGRLGAYLAAGPSTLGLLTINDSILPLAYGASFTGLDLATAPAGMRVCVSTGVDLLGQLTGGSVVSNEPPTATVTETSTPTPTATKPPTPTATATATPTDIPTATPSPTSTPIPPTLPAPAFKKVSLSGKTVRLGGTETLTVQAASHAKQAIRVHVMFPSGAHLDFKGKTDTKGHWSKSFHVPSNASAKSGHTTRVSIVLRWHGLQAKKTLTFSVSK